MYKKIYDVMLLHLLKGLKIRQKQNKHNCEIMFHCIHSNTVIHEHNMVTAT